MLPFEFDRGLLPFELNTPAFVPLFQLPPRLKDRCNSTTPQKRSVPYACGLLLTDFSRPPIIFPISTSFADHTAYRCLSMYRSS